MPQNAYHRVFKCILENLLLFYRYATKAISRTIPSQVSKPAHAGKEADLMNSKIIAACFQNS